MLFNIKYWHTKNDKEQASTSLASHATQSAQKWFWKWRLKKCNEMKYVNINYIT